MFPPSTLSANSADSPNPTPILICDAQKLHSVPEKLLHLPHHTSALSAPQTAAPVDSLAAAPLVHLRPAGYVESAFGAPIRLLGGGTGGSVTLHRHPWTGNLLAIKRYVLPSHLTQSGRQRVVTNEANITLRLQHPNIVRTYVYVAEEDGSLHSVMEAVPHDLFSVRMIHINSLFRQIVDAVAYMHLEHGVAHRDLKLDNICLDSNGTIRIIDFGCATKCAAVKRSGSSNTYSNAIVPVTGVCGSDPYIAPEVFESRKQPGLGYDATKVDVWALGIIYMAMVSVHFPWSVAQVTDANFVRYMMHPEVVIKHWLTRRSPSPANGVQHQQCCENALGHADAISLTRRMLAVDPAQRISCEQILEDGWFQTLRQ
ncbi:kinase-like protein [Ramicandelaber brevisporus]|nr:kinase-like protein [Ramicandelaber brevisporus]